MFENITEKIRVMAKVFLVLGAVGWIVIGIACSYNAYLEEWNFPLLFGLIIGGLLLDFLGCFVLHGFADLIDSLESNKSAIFFSTRLPSVHGPKYSFEEESLLGMLHSIKGSSDELVKLSEELDEEA